MIIFSSLRKQLTLRDITPFFQQTELWGPILMTCHYWHWSCWLKQISISTRPIRSTTKIWVVTRHQHGNSVVSDVISRENQWWSPETLPKIAFLVLLKLTKKKNVTSSFLDWNSLCGYYRYFKLWICQKSCISPALSWKILSRVFEILWLNNLSRNLRSMFYWQQQRP